MSDTSALGSADTSLASHDTAYVTGLGAHESPVLGSINRDSDYSGFVTGLASGGTGPNLLGYSSYLHGSNGGTLANAVAKDGQSNIVVAGQSEATDLPGTAGTQQASNAGGTDAFVSKLITTPTCPSGEDCVDIGSPALAGDQLQSGSRATGTWSVTGSGADIWGTSDQFHFVAQDAAGDGSISARILGQTNTGQYAKAGVMYRASEDPAAPYYFVALTPANGGTLQVQYRAAQGAVAQDLSDFLVTAPLYVRVRRTGNQFTADTSSDGQTWTPLANTTTTIDAMPATALAGLAVDSYNTGASSTATFDNVTINSCPTAWDCQDIGGPAQAGGQTIRDEQSLEGLVNFPVRGGGADIEGTSDQFHFVDTTLAGDGSVSTRISSQQNTDAWAKAGVMLRASANADAPYYFVLVTPGNGVDVQYRATPGGQGGATQWPSHLDDTTPVYLRADRVGTTFSAYSSHDAVNWRLIPNSTVSIPALAGDLLAGPAVTSHNTGATSAATFDFVRVDQCPDGWSCGDINGPTVPGGQYFNNGIFSLRGVGTGVGPSTVQDQFHYVWRSIVGDSDLSARLSSQVNTATGAKAGLMYRADTTPGAPYFVAAMTANNGLVVQARTTAGGTAATIATSSTASLPLYLRITRAGNTFTAYTSPDDTTWTPIANASVSIPAMPTTAQLGLATDSFDPNATSTAVFASVNISGTSNTLLPSGADLSVLDSPNMRYTQGNNGTVHVQIYPASVGAFNQGQWQQRDTSLTTDASTGMYRSNNAAFSEQMAPSSAGMAPSSTGPTLASLTNENGVTLSVGLVATPTPTTGQMRTNSVTYASAESSGAMPSTTMSDLSLLSTMSGLDARVVISNSNAIGPFALTLSSGPSTQITQTVSGTIQATQDITGLSDDGVTPYTTTQTEYIVQPPIVVDASMSVTAAVTTGPATATLTTSGSGQPTINLSVDPTWLKSPSRVFPINLDVPIVTGDSAVHSGLWGTVNSCAPNILAPLTAVVVGAAGGCTYNGQAYFDLGSIDSDATIVSATLRLYTPAQTTATGVQIYQNAPVSLDNDPSALSSWSTAPAVMAGATGIGQTGSDGHWQNWDVTNVAQQWVQDNSTNGGLTLVGNNAPVLFLSPLGVGGTSPAYAPYLDITYAKPTSPRFTDINSTGVRNKVVYGVSGSFALSGNFGQLPDPGTPPTVPSPYIFTCNSGSLTGKASCGGNIAVNKVSQLGGSLLRLSVQMRCPSSPAPGDNGYDEQWWTFPGISSDYAGQPIANQGHLPEEILANAYSEGLIPIVTFVAGDDPACLNFLGNTNQGTAYLTHWQQEVASFVGAIEHSSVKLASSKITVGQAMSDTTGKYFTYFEIGNEQNNHNYDFYGLNPPRSTNPANRNNYPPIFAAAASGIYSTLGSGAGYRILTTGMVEPSANRKDPGPQVIPYGPHTPNDYSVAAQAIRVAATQKMQDTTLPLTSVPYPKLGFAVHPYHYDTPASSGYWRNFYNEYGTSAGFNGWRSSQDLGGMISLWSSQVSGSAGAQLPVVFTESNWSDHPRDTDSGDQHCRPNDGITQGCSGTYLVDLFTYLNDYCKTAYQNQCARTTFTRFPIRVAWYRGADKGEDPRRGPVLGMYSGAGQPKKFNLLIDCKGPHNLTLPYRTISGAFQTYRNTACY